MLAAVGMLSGMMGGGSASSEAKSGGMFTSGDVNVGESDTLIIAAVVLLGLFIIFRRKK